MIDTLTNEQCCYFSYDLFIYKINKCGKLSKILFSIFPCKLRGKRKYFKNHKTTKNNIHTLTIGDYKSQSRYKFMYIFIAYLCMYA